MNLRALRHAVIVVMALGIGATASAQNYSVGSDMDFTADPNRIPDPNNSNSAPPATSCKPQVVASYGPCSVGCGGGSATYTLHDLNGCVADSTATTACNVMACPVCNPKLVSSYGACTASCGGGTRTVTVHDANNCGGADTVTTQSCNTQSC